MRLAISCAFFLTVSVGYSQTKLYPKSEISQHQGLSAFEAKLRSVIANGDTTTLFTLLDEDILNGFGGEGGVEEFKQYWNLPKGLEKLWLTLTELLGLGGTIDKDPDNGEVIGATWPYTFTHFPDELDAYNYMVVIGSGVALREKPSIDSKVIARLSYDVLPYDYDLTYRNKANPIPEEGFEYVKWIALTYKGQTGYVSSKYVRSPIDYRMSVLYDNGEWKIVILVAGD